MPLDTGFKLEEDAIKLFADMKLGSKTIRSFTLKIVKEEGVICIEGKSNKGNAADQRSDYEALCQSLPKSECRFIVVDLAVKRKNDSDADQIFFLCWNPDTSPIQSKTIYSSTRGSITNTLKMGAAAIIIQANDFDDIDYDTLMAKAKR